MQANLKELFSTLFKFACVLVPLVVVSSIFLEVKAAIDANPLLKVPAIAGSLAVVFIVIKAKVIRSRVYNVRVINESKD